MLNQSTIELLKDFVLPIISILTFILSVLTLFISSIVNRRRLLVSNVVRFMRFSSVKFSHQDSNRDIKGVLVSFDIINPSPHDIGIHNLELFNGSNKLFIETGPAFKHVFLDNLTESFPLQKFDLVITSNSQFRVTYLVNENHVNKIMSDELTIKFNGIFTDWFYAFRHPVKHYKSPEKSLKAYTINQNIKHEINVPRRLATKI